MVFFKQVVKKLSESNSFAAHFSFYLSQNFFHFFLAQLQMPWEVFHCTIELGNFQRFAPIFPESTIVQVPDAGLDVVLRHKIIFVNVYQF